MHWLFFDGVIMCCETGSYFKLYENRIKHFVAGVVTAADFGDYGFAGKIHEEEFVTEAMAIEKFEHLKDYLKARTL
jgi:hypothetical protein